jgi:hypothetical protein
VSSLPKTPFIAIIVDVDVEPGPGHRVCETVRVTEGMRAAHILSPSHESGEEDGEDSPCGAVEGAGAGGTPVAIAR